MNLKNSILIIVVLGLATFLLFFGETGFNYDSVLIGQLRLPKVVVCLLAGGMLALAGLLMQIFFQNPLAGPDILGISSGASLFVAFWMMAAAGVSESLFYWGANAMSFAGAVSVFLVLMLLVQKNMSRISLIIVGVLISSFASSGISVLVNFSQTLQLKNYLLWSMGSFRNLTAPELPMFIGLSLSAMFPIILFLKPLNQFLLTENYAKSMGANVKRMRLLFVAFAALQISIVTMYCGPIGFIGIISPHLARQFLKRAQLNTILPASFFIGAMLALIAETIIVLAPEASISVNAILGLIGAPVIILYLYRQRGWSI